MKKISVILLFCFVVLIFCFIGCAKNDINSYLEEKNYTLLWEDKQKGITKDGNSYNYVCLVENNFTNIIYLYFFNSGEPVYSRKIN